MSFKKRKYQVLVSNGQNVEEQTVEGYVDAFNIFAYKFNLDLDADRQKIEIDHLPTGRMITAQFIDNTDNIENIRKKPKNQINLFLTTIPHHILRTTDPYNKELLASLLKCLNDFR